MVETPDRRPVAVLTDEHAASSYGVPVLVVAGEALGPKDPLPFVETAADRVLSWASHPSIDAERRELARRFLASWPEGPQMPKATS